MKKIYEIFLTTKAYNEIFDYDAYDGHIIIAENPKEARELCPYGVEGKQAWLNPKYSMVRPVGTTKRKKSVVLLSSYNAG